MESLGTLLMYAIIVMAMIVFSVLAVTTRKILRSATYLLFALFATAGVYFMLDYQFLGAVQIAVYAGGIVVLFVFSILLTSKPGDNSPALASKSRVMGLVAALAMLACSAYALLARCQLFNAATDHVDPTMKQIGETMMSNDGYLLPFEAISILLLACIIGGVVVARKR